MRLIPDEALDLIAGGYDDIPVVVIVGNTGGGGGGAGGMGGGFGGSGVASFPTELGNGTTDHGDPEPEKQHSSPLPPNPPAGVDVNHLRNVAVILSAWMKIPENQNIEYGSVIVKYADGTIGGTKISYGSMDDDRKVHMRADLAPGDKIIGYIHSHPADPYDVRTPSADDFEEWAKVRQQPYADPNMIAYILDVKSGDVYEYDSTAVYTRGRTIGKNISQDIIYP